MDVKSVDASWAASKRNTGHEWQHALRAWVYKCKACADNGKLIFFQMSKRELPARRPSLFPGFFSKRKMKSIIFASSTESENRA